MHDQNNLDCNSAVAEAPTQTVTPTSVITDAFGVEIRKGDTIVFAVRKGSSQWLNKLRVTGVTSATVKGYDPDDTMQRAKTLRQMKTVVVTVSANLLEPVN